MVIQFKLLQSKPAKPLTTRGPTSHLNCLKKNLDWWRATAGIDISYQSSTPANSLDMLLARQDWIQKLVLARRGLESSLNFPDPLQDQKDGAHKKASIITLGNLGDYGGDPFLDPLGGLALEVRSIRDGLFVCQKLGHCHRGLIVF